MSTADNVELQDGGPVAAARAYGPVEESRHILAISVGHKVRTIATTLRVKSTALDEGYAMFEEHSEVQEEPIEDEADLSLFVESAPEEVKEDVLDLIGDQGGFDPVDCAVFAQYENLKSYLTLGLRARWADPGGVRSIRPQRKPIRSELWASEYSPFAGDLPGSFIERIIRRRVTS
ncbi:hypothetical protein Pmar_PMAR014757 [Perkinsus marinus ATCC 50983]|uniref:Uncharacterized protein n=1 Tax=Perkinsus marinus (strain ATCC 50983 / TXsc) TaxID=423536 RepID=C5KAF4_PERM5|nr:hypothetical protein Pmar_PMAR014757 [Perkinsus marinus ATCC 50983]EER18539.1 hypothetical protein Pmar_PMAR014757 [Perkinsus marinus ATCC 50983]|eukprot:XP_002786743.1 hypothetical protein Pmar_PMAR014757 [Perkinsus marinus ATCC 50983]